MEVRFITEWEAVAQMSKLDSNRSRLRENWEVITVTAVLGLLIESIYDIINGVLKSGLLAAIPVMGGMVGGASMLILLRGGILRLLDKRPSIKPND
jgi:hypothetical protein